VVGDLFCSLLSFSLASLSCDTFAAEGAHDFMDLHSTSREGDVGG